MSEDQAFLNVGSRELGSNLQNSVFANEYIGNRIQGADSKQAALEAILKDPQALNSYSYARNNPVKFVDRDGKLIQVPAAILGFGLGLAGRYIGDIATNISQGQQGLSIFRANSSLSSYLVSGIEGAVEGVVISTFPLAGPLLAGGTAGVSSLVQDKLEGKKLNFGNAAIETVGVAVTGGLIKSFPKPSIGKIVLTSPVAIESVKASIDLLSQYVIQLTNSVKNLTAQPNAP